tara:strand:- start:1592 stop:2542 length:951 start_codon:yes stop_codon:yes gene_type:complete
MNYLITGGTGFLGSHLVKRLLTDDEAEITVVSTSIRDKNSIKSLKVDLEKINLVVGDIRDFQFVRKLFNEYEFDHIYHLGALSEVRKCQSDAKLAYDVNIGGTVNILECVRLYGNVKSIVVSSSDKAYGKGNIPYVEDQSLNGEAIYEASKSCTDIVARSYYYNYDLPVVVTRCSNLYGAGDVNFSRLIPNTIRRLVRGQSPMIYKGVADCTREFLYVDDAVDACLLLSEEIERTKGKAYNVGGESIFTIKEVVEKLINKVDPSIDVIYKEKNFPEIDDQYLDSSKIKNELGWTPRTSFDVGLGEAINFYKKYCSV